MALARDANTGFQSSGGNTLNFTALTVSASDPIIVLGFTAGTSDNITSVTAGGNAMTQIQKVQNGSGRWSYLYYIVGESGSVSISISATDSAGFIGGVAASYTGASQTGQPDSSNTNTASSATSLTVSTTVVASDCWLAGWWYTTGTSIAAGTGASAVATNSDNLGFFDSNATVGTGSQSMQVTSTSGNLAGLMASIAPAGAAAGGAGTGRLMMMGMGR